jgi:hypothetical protein
MTVARSFAFAFLFVFTILLLPFDLTVPVPVLFLILSTIMSAASATFIFPGVCRGCKRKSNQHSW